MITNLLKQLNDNGIKDGLLRNFAIQEPRNDRAIIDAINTAIDRRDCEIEFLSNLKDEIEKGEV